MDHDELRHKLLTEVLAVDAAALLPHHRRGALLVLAADVDLISAAVAIATDDVDTVQKLAADGALVKPSLAQLADWCVDAALRFQFIILQPHVLAQPMLRDAD
jgi:hypothetical protein